MATSSLNAFVVIMATLNSTIDETALHADTAYQNMANLSSGTRIQESTDQQWHYSGGGVWDQVWMLEVTFFVLPTDVATMQTNMTTLVTDFPTYSIRCYTYPITWGF